MSVKFKSLLLLKANDTMLKSIAGASSSPYICSSG